MQTNFALMQHHKYSLTELEYDTMGEEIYITLLTQYIEEENEKGKTTEKINGRRNKKAGFHQQIQMVMVKYHPNEQEMYLEFKRKELEDADARRDAMRTMTWFALLGMLFYRGHFDYIITWTRSCAKLIADIAPTYFVAISALVGTYFGANAYADKKSK